MKRLLIIILSISCSTVLLAQKETPPVGGTPKNFVLPEKTSFSLENGLNIVLVPYGSLPKVTVSVVVKTGNIHEGDDQVWLSDIMADLMQEGTITKSAQEVSIAAANMGGSVNVNVGLNQTSASGEVLSEFGADLISLLADVIQNPKFPKEELPRLINDRKRQLSVQMSRPQSLASEKFNEIIYGDDNAYGDIYPTEEMLDSYAIEDVISFYSENFGAKRTTVYVAGVFDQKKMKTAVTKAFEEWTGGPEVSYKVPEVSAHPGVEILDRPGAVQSTIMMGLPVVDPSHDDYIPLSITNYLLGGSFSSRITSNIREDKGYTYSPFSTVNTRYGAATWYESADVTTDVTGPSLKEISYEINKLRSEVPTDEELEGIKNYRAGVFVLQNSSPGGIIGQLSFLDLHGLEDTYLTNYVKSIYAVTPEQVREMTEKYLDYEKMTIVVVGDKKVIDQQIEDYQNEIEEF
ncbi:MAG: pitrilysin family protein [Cyclobacteriaceae bacterium]